MCSTAILPIVGIVGTALSGFMQYQGAKAEAKAIEQAGEARRALAYRNADAMRREAEGERVAGKEEAHREKLKAMIAQGELLTGMGASGADVGSGSFVNILLTNSMTGQENAANANRNAELRARALENQAVIARFEGDVDAFTAASAAAGKRTSAKAGLLSSALGVASKWSDFNKTRSSNTPYQQGMSIASKSPTYYGVYGNMKEPKLSGGTHYGGALAHGNAF